MAWERDWQLSQGTWKKTHPPMKLVPNLLAVVACFLSARVSVPTLLGWNSKKQGYLQAYVVVWVGFLVALLFLARDPGQRAQSLLDGLIVALAFYRLQDLILSSVDDGLELTTL